jgi:hypothetical protein
MALKPPLHIGEYHEAENTVAIAATSTRTLTPANA